MKYRCPKCGSTNLSIDLTVPFHLNGWTGEILFSGDESGEVEQYSGDPTPVICRNGDCQFEGTRDEFAIASGLEIARYLVLSTAHVDEAARALLDSKDAFAGLANYEHGWYVWVPPEDEKREVPLPECLSMAFALAREHDCTYLRFDQDGPEVDGLPTFDW